MKNIDKKHLLVVGKDEIDRHNFVKNLLDTSDKQIYKIPSGIKRFEEYIEHVKRSFPFIPENWDEQNPNKWTLNQVWDFHLDWTEKTHSILILIEEFGMMEENWKIEIMKDYISKSYHQEESKKSHLNFQLVVTQENEDNIIDKLSAVIGLNEHETRTERQVVLGKLNIINLDLE